MYIYKRTIVCPNSIEIEYYKSIRKVGKYYGGRSRNTGLSNAKQKEANKLRNILKWSRLIDCNFDSSGSFCRFSAPYGIFDTEEKFMREVKNFFSRIKRRCQKQGIEFKYIGFRECGKSGKNWHMHIVLNEEVRKIAYECWHWKDGGTNFSPIWTDGKVRGLAEYIRKDVSGEKRMMCSRNLSRPEITVEPAKKREVAKLERGEVCKAPDGWYLSKDEFRSHINEITGASFGFVFRPLIYRNGKKRIEKIRP